MKALLIRLLGIAKIIANYLFSDQGKLVMKWASKAVEWVREAEGLNSGDLPGHAKFEYVSGRVSEALKSAGHEVTESLVRKIVELAHGAFENHAE